MASEMHILTPQGNHIKGHICQHQFSPHPWRPTITSLSKSLCLGAGGAVLTGTQPWQLLGRAGLAALTGRPGCSVGRSPSPPAPAREGPPAHALSLPLSYNRNMAATSCIQRGERFCTPFPTPGLQSSLYTSFPFPQHPRFPLHTARSRPLSLSPPCSCTAPDPPELSFPWEPAPFHASDGHVPSSRAQSAHHLTPRPRALSLQLLLLSEQSWPEKSVSAPSAPPLPPTPSTQKGTEATDGLVLAEGLREAAAPQRPLLGLS